MDEYTECITKHRAKHFVCEFCNEHCSDEPCEPNDCEWMRFIETEPATDVVEVVRCKDCRWYQVRKWDDGAPQYDCRKTHALLDVKPDDFCSYGERRVDNGD